MSDHNVQFPDKISERSSTGISYKTLITELSSGVEERVSRTSTPRHRFLVEYNNRRIDEMSALRNFIHLRNGSAHTFRMRDYMDFCTSSAKRPSSFMLGVDPTATDQVLGVGTGSNQTYELYRKYSDGTSPNLNRRITKPREASLLIAFDGVAQTEGVTWTCDYATGQVIANAPLGQEITWGGLYDTPVRFGKSAEEFLAQTFNGFDNAGVGEIEMIEVLSEEGVVDDFNYGGGNEFSFSMDTALNLVEGRVKVANATTTGLNLILPDTDPLALGAPYLYIRANPSGSAFSVRDQDNVLIAAMTPGDIFEFGVWPDGSGGKTWLAR